MKSFFVFLAVAVLTGCAAWFFLGMSHEGSPGPAERRAKAGVPPPMTDALSRRPDEGRQTPLSSTAAADSPYGQANERLPTATSSAPDASGEASINPGSSQAEGYGPPLPYEPASLAGNPAAHAVDPANAAMQYEIPAGMRAPVVFLPEDRPLTPPMERFLQNVRDEFDAVIAAADNPADVWEAARQRADDRYRLLLGDEAYNDKTMRDAIEALRSKQAPSAMPAAQ